MRATTYYSSICHHCSEESVINSGSYSYCGYHYRFMRMRIEAKSKGKVVPTKEQLTEILAKHEDMVCPNCKCAMHWLGRDGYPGLITLQHNMDGTFGMLCHPCNAAHQFIPRDGFYNKPAGERYCQDCRAFKPIRAFFKDARLKGGVKTYCKECANKRTYRWRRAVGYQGKEDWVAY